MTWLERKTRELCVTLAPANFPWRGFLATLALGVTGALLFDGWGIPLPWMLGSMTIVTLGAVLRLPLVAPAVVRSPMTAIIGVMLGGGFTPDLLGNAAAWGVTLAGLMAYTVMAAALCLWYLVNVAGYERKTAFFSAMPGGLVEMIELGTAKGADIRIVALTHGARVLVIVFTMPILIQFLDSSAGADIQQAARPGLAETSVLAFVELIIAAIAGVWVGERLRLPARHLLGPMLVSGLVHLSGIARFTPAAEIVQAAQLVIGTILGARFVGTAPALIGRTLAVAIGMVAILVSTTIAMAVCVSLFVDQSIIVLILAYTPGGLPEMSLLAIALGADVAFVATHHLFRLLAVMLGAGQVYRLFSARSRAVETPAE
jgi:membrane AbrB-like protein